MKKIEAIIRSQNFSTLKASLSKIGQYIIAKHDISNNDVFDKQTGPKVGNAGLKSIPLAKIELVVPDTDAKNVIEIISRSSGIKSKDGGKIFVSEMTEIVDMDTLEGEKELEASSVVHTTKRSRLVPLQKYTLLRIDQFYAQNKDLLQANYKIKSFSDLVNFCILEYLPTLDEKINPQKTVYGLNRI
ncbi:P-II family nitrogen regulator [Candidatus Nitrosotenuis sp. DW1]|uniref:P-II family nitrogen regulator n=1 Tax=Candidatus Nitrosotenuis sp. DW1 TaxID=2259672 RepID=UPI0015C76EE2|nr:P-II family nitrogen regulator [Candidatus Nitrosotenuis sp. DW1]QLH08528.1 transcriptional regulator [Candidatus Nitrosotenuis sp. DW1]